MRNNWLPEVVQRSETGPYQKEEEFEMQLSRRTAELVKEYDLKFEGDTPVPSDDAMADRLYQAGLQLFLDMGVYNQSTKRKIFFERQEVEELVAAAHNFLTLGLGKDAVLMRSREVEGTIPAVIHSGPTGTPCSEKFHPYILQSCAQEPLVDCLGAGSVSTYQGHEIIPGTPLELLGSRRDAGVAREAVRMAGRPGMHINDVAVSLTCEGKMAAFDPQAGLRSSDALLISQMVEMKTDYDQLSRVAFQRNVGMHIVDLMTPLIGGLGGGAEGTAVVTVACHILGVVLYDASYHMMSHTHLRWVNNTDRMGLWMQALVGQALTRNTPIVLLNDIYTVSGPGTEELLWEVAAGAVTGSVCGMNVQAAGCTGGFETDHYTGIEARFAAEAAHAALGMTREEANAFCLRFLEKYEHTFDEPDRGYPYQELYDVEKGEPNQKWLVPYHKVREEIIEMGLDLENGWRKVRND